jgi:hypothetical protein
MNDDFQGLIRVFVTIVILSLALVCAVNVYVNPFSQFGERQLSNPQVTSDRMEKFHFVESLGIKPQAFILGSSNSMRVKPSVLEEYTGFKSFNYGVNHASSEDFWCISNVLLKDLNIKPKFILLCADDWDFAEIPRRNDEFFCGLKSRSEAFDLICEYQIGDHFSSFDYVQGIDVKNFDEPHRIFERSYQNGLFKNEIMNILKNETYK